MTELTYKQAMLMYDHAVAWISQKDVDYDEEPEPLQNATIRPDGARVISK